MTFAGALDTSTGIQVRTQLARLGSEVVVGDQGSFTGAPVSQLRQMQALSASSRWMMRARSPAGRWSGWYAEAIPLAEERYAVYQRENGEKEQR